MAMTAETHPELGQRIERTSRATHEIIQMEAAARAESARRLKDLREAKQATVRKTQRRPTSFRNRGPSAGVRAAHARQPVASRASPLLDPRRDICGNDRRRSGRAPANRRSRSESLVILRSRGSAVVRPIRERFHHRRSPGSLQQLTTEPVKH